MPVRPILFFVLALPLIGCGDLSEFSQKKDPKSEPTYRFWTSLYHIHDKDFSGIRKTLDETKSAIQKSGVERASELLQELSEKHQRIAEQLGRLDHENVDAEALAFRDQLVQGHRSLAETCKHYGNALTGRDSEVIQRDGSRFVKLYEDLRDLWIGSTEVIESLEAKYGRDFNIQR